MKQNQIADSLSKSFNFDDWGTTDASTNTSLIYGFPTLHKKWSFPLRISSVNVTKSAGSCAFGHIHCRNAYWKTSFFVQCTFADNFNKKVATFNRKYWSHNTFQVNAFRAKWENRNNYYLPSTDFVSRITKHLQSRTKYLRSLSRFSKVSFHPKQNGTRLFSPESECTSCLIIGQMT